MKDEKKAYLIDTDLCVSSNTAIVKYYLDNGLIQRCVDCQFLKMPEGDRWKMQYKEDFFQDLIVILLTYGNEKMNNAHLNNHMNALITRIIQNNIYSDHSDFYLRYLRLRNRSQEIDRKIETKYLGVQAEW